MEKIGIVDKIQEKMCDTVYAKLRELMVSVHRKEVLIKLNSKSDIKFTIIGDGIYVYQGPNFNFIGDMTPECKTDFIFEKIIIPENNIRLEAYKNWVETVESKIIELSQEEQEYQKLLDKIIDMPILTKQREVLFEKKS